MGIGKYNTISISAYNSSLPLRLIHVHIVGNKKNKFKLSD